MASPSTPAKVNANPVDARTLLGVFPTVVRGAAGGAALLAAVTCDGAHFSSPTPLFNASHVAGEIVDHAVDGVAVDGDAVVFYAHAGVPGTFDKVCAYKRLFPKPGDRAHGEDPGWAPPASRVVALYASAADVRDATAAGVARLRAAGKCRRSSTRESLLA